MKKEPLSIIIVKTLLAVTIFTGIGTIIFGGGVLIVKFYNSGINDKMVKPIDQEAENYYDLLEKKCGKIHDSCCLSSLDIMRQGGYIEADENGNCSDGFEMNMQKCITTFQWCEPIKKIDRKSCEQDYDCVETQADCCSCSSGGKQIGINKRYLKDWENTLEEKCQDVGCIALFNCKEGKVVCKNNKCEFEEKLNNNDRSDISDWQTYRNEEFGFEIKHKHFSGKVCSPCIDNNQIDFYLYEDGENVPYSDFGVTILKNDKKLSAERLAESIKESIGDEPWFSGVNMTEQKTEVNGYDAYVLNNVWGGDCGMRIYFVVYKDQAVQISFTESTPNYDDMAYNLKIFNQMLSTFRFIEN